MKYIVTKIDENISDHNNLKITIIVSIYLHVPNWCFSASSLFRTELTFKIAKSLWITVPSGKGTLPSFIYFRLLLLHALVFDTRLAPSMYNRHRKSSTCKNHEQKLVMQQNTVKINLKKKLNL